MDNKILIILPTLNEAKNINILFNEIKKLEIRFNYLFIDDNSSDGTRKYIVELKKNYTNIDYIFNDKRKGIGRAHKDGLLWAYKNNYDHVITMDTDLAHHPKYIIEVLKKKTFSDIIVGSRYLEKNSTPGWSKFRILLSNSAHIFYKLIYRSNLDSTNAFRFYNLKSINPKFLHQFNYEDYEFFFTSLILLKKQGCKIDQIPMTISGRSHGSSKMLIKHIFKSIITMFSFYFKSKNF